MDRETPIFRPLPQFDVEAPRLGLHPAATGDHLGGGLHVAPLGGSQPSDSAPLVVFFSFGLGVFAWFLDGLLVGFVYLSHKLNFEQGI